MRRRSERERMIDTLFTAAMHGLEVLVWEFRCEMPRWGVAVHFGSPMAGRFWLAGEGKAFKKLHMPSVVAVQILNAPKNLNSVSVNGFR